MDRTARARPVSRLVPLVVALVLGGSGSVSGAAPLRPFPQHVALAAGTLLPSHRSRAQLDDDVRVLYGAWKSRYLVQAGTEADGHPRFRVLFSRSPNDRTVSEGMGYGMILAALMAGHDPDAEILFDGLWEFARDHRSVIDPRLMDWSVPADERPDRAGDDSAFDGDADMALALLLAAGQWGAGRFDYAGEARAVIAGIRESTIGPESRLPMLGDWVDPNGAVYSQYTTRTSDFMLSNFRAFALATGDPVWNQVIAATQAAAARIQTLYSPATGLLPDFLEPVSPSDLSLRPADSGFLEGPNDGAYGYNAVRVPFRLGLDAALSGDATSRAQVRKISAWAEAATGGDPSRVYASRRLDGTVLPGNDYFTTIFAATLGVAAMSTPGRQEWLNDLYDAVRLSDEGYYEDSVTLLSLLAMTGNFWVPAGAAPVCGNGAVEVGEVCDDGDLDEGDGCDSNCTPTACGNGVRSAGEVCDDGNVVAGDCCDSECQLEPNGSLCDDGDPCSFADACGQGTCAGVLAPADGCSVATGGSLLLKDNGNGKRQLKWRWKGASAIGDFGDPLDGTSFALCLFEAEGGGVSLVARSTAAAGGSCGGPACWSSNATGFAYKHPAAGAGGLQLLKLSAAGGSAKLLVKARDAMLPALDLPLAQDPAVTVQLRASGGGCWETRLEAPASKNDPRAFADRP